MNMYVNMRKDDSFMPGSYGFGKRKKIKSVSAAEIIFIVVFSVAIIIMLSFTFLFSKEGVARKFFNTYIYLSRVTVMEPSIPVNSAVFANPDEISSLAPGMVVLFKVEYNDEEIVTISRIQEIQQDGDKKYYILRGDSNLETEAIRIPEENIIAKCTNVSVPFGAVLSFAVSKPGIFTIIIAPCLAVIIFQIIHIVRVNKYSESYDEDDDDEYDDEDDYDDDDEDDEDEEEVHAGQRGNVRYSEPPVKKIYVGGEGKAEYLKNAAPNADYRDLNEAMRNAGVQKRSNIGAPNPAAQRLNAQRETVNENFRQKPVTRDMEFSSEIFAPRREKSYLDIEQEFAPPPAVRNPSGITIPEDAKKPSKTIAPPPKQSSNKTVEELMRAIDKAQSGLKK